MSAMRVFAFASQEDRASGNTELAVRSREVGTRAELWAAVEELEDRFFLACKQGASDLMTIGQAVELLPG